MTTPTPSSRPDAAEPVAAVREHVQSHRDAFVDDLSAWLRIPSVSADPARAGDVRASADWLAAHLRDTGFPVVEVWETAASDGTAGLPAVYAHWPSDDPAAPRVVVYGHHDVQPADPGGWAHPPFEPTLDGDLLHARGAADDKGQVLFHTLGLRAHLAASGRTSPAVHLTLLVEGEEESGSPNLADLLRRQRDRLGCDVVVVSDTGVWGRDTPSTCIGMRGLTDGEITLRGPETDIHSGAFGGAVPNPAAVLARLLAALHDADGHVTLPGFYDGVAEITGHERELLARLPFDEATWLGNARSRATGGEAGYSTLERVWVRPTAEINGMWSGYIGAGHKTIVPADAHAKVSFRLVPGQEPAAVQESLRRWVSEQVPAGIEADVAFFGPGVRPCLTPLDHPALAAVARSLGAAFGTEVLYTREGGSGPEADLQDVLEAPVVFLGVSLPDDGWHAPDEKVEVPQLLAGAVAAALLWADLAASLPRGGRAPGEDG